MNFLTEEAKEKLNEIGLSRREIEICESCMNHASNVDISQDLGCTPKTVKFHFTSIYKKLKVFCRPALMIYLMPLLSIGAD